MEEFEPQFSEIPNIGQLLQQKMAAKKASSETAIPKPGSVDPYKLMVQKNQINRGEIAAPMSPIQQWPEEDLKELQDYCQKMGIFGFNYGTMNPKLALRQLKQQVGDMSDVSLENRIPAGYERKGTISSTSPNYPFSKPQPQKKSLLTG